MKVICGVILLILGVLIIFWGLWQSYGIFKAKKPVPEIFVFEKEEGVEKEEEETKGLEEKVGQEIQEAVSSQFSKLLPSEFVAKILNLLSWTLFVFILMAAGGKLALVGVRLLK